MLSSLVLSTVGILNELISLSFLEALHLGKTHRKNTFLRDKKVTSQIPITITDETKMKRYTDVSLQLLCRFESLSPNKTTLKELKQRDFFSFKLFCVFITMF